MIDQKFIYNYKIKFKLLPSIFCFHSSYIKKSDFYITVRGLIFYKENLIYIRINPYTNDTEKTIFNSNLKNCLKYLKKKYPKYKIYTNHNIHKFPENMKYLLK